MILHLLSQRCPMKQGRHIQTFFVLAGSTKSKACFSSSAVAGKLQQQCGSDSFSITAGLPSLLLIRYGSTGCGYRWKHLESPSPDDWHIRSLLHRDYLTTSLHIPHVRGMTIAISQCLWRLRFYQNFTCTSLSGYCPSWFRLQGSSAPGCSVPSQSMSGAFRTLGRWTNRYPLTLGSWADAGLAQAAPGGSRWI